MLGYRERIHPTDPRLGRNVNHDERSRAYPFLAPERVVLHAVQHQRHVPIFDQGNLGSCTGNAAVGCLATGQFRATIDSADADWLQPLDENAAVRCYSDATKIDPWPGEWIFPPSPGSGDDTGSDGLSVAKVLTDAGAISGYQHAFTLTDALAALMDRPLITGTWWTNDMYDPGPEGLVTPTGTDRGGHEFVASGYDPVRGWVWFDNSWTARWGLAGRFAMEAEAYGALLARDGDVTVFTPITQPAPTPDPLEPATAADRALAAAVMPWARRNAWCGRSIRRALRTWGDVKGL